MDTFIALSVRQIIASIRLAEWDDNNVLQDVLGLSAGAFLRWKACCYHNPSNGIYLAVPAFYDRGFCAVSPSMSECLLSARFESDTIDALQLSVRQWLFDNVEKAYQMLLERVRDEGGISSDDAGAQSDNSTILNLPLDALHFPKRVTRLKECGVRAWDACAGVYVNKKIETIRDLVSCTAEDLINVPDFGTGSLRKVRKTLERFDLYLKGD